MSSKELIFCCIIALGGCAYEGAAQKTEILLRDNLIGTNSVVDDFFDRPTFDNARYALRLGEQYKFLGDRAATSRDATSLGLILVAGYAALGSAVSIAANDLATAAVVGVAANEGAKYVSPNSVAEAFYIASDQMTCIGVAIAELFGDEAGMISKDVPATAVAISFIRKSELVLRTALRREVPDLSTLNNAFGVPQLVDYSPGLNNSSQTLSVALRTKLSACIDIRNDE